MGILDKAKEMLGMDGADDLVGDAKANAQDAMGDAKDAGGGMTDKAKGAMGGMASGHIDKGSDAIKPGIDKVSGS